MKIRLFSISSFDILLLKCRNSSSDAVNLRKSDIKDDHIEVTTIKTADSISIELNEMTAAILNKYKDYVFKNGRALPPYTNQAMNRDLKELCKLAGICEEQRITSYKGCAIKSMVCRIHQTLFVHINQFAVSLVNIMTYSHSTILDG